MVMCSMSDDMQGVETECTNDMNSLMFRQNLRGIIEGHGDHDQKREL